MSDYDYYSVDYDTPYGVVLRSPFGGECVVPKPLLSTRQQCKNANYNCTSKYNCGDMCPKFKSKNAREIRLLKIEARLGSIERRIHSIQVELKNLSKWDDV